MIDNIVEILSSERVNYSDVDDGWRVMRTKVSMMMIMSLLLSEYRRG